MQRFAAAEAKVRHDGHYNIWAKTFELCSYPMQSGKDTFRYASPRWIVVDVVVGEAGAKKRAEEFLKR